MKKPDISRTTFVLWMLALAIVSIGLLMLDSWYQMSLIKYPPDRPMIPREVEDCAKQKKNNWPIDEICQYAPLSPFYHQDR